jgi:hypothetical protein
VVREHPAVEVHELTQQLRDGARVTLLRGGPIQAGACTAHILAEGGVAALR